MIFMIAYIFSVAVALGLGGLAALSDFKGMTIPNGIVVGIAVAFIVGYAAAAMGGADIFFGLKSHLFAFGAVLAITFLMFAVKMIGGGDSKLVAVFALWVGLRGLVPFLFYMALLGALFGIGALVIRKVKPFKGAAEGSWLQRVQAGEGVVPYGIPIFAGAFIAFFETGLLSLEALKLFLIPN